MVYPKEDIMHWYIIVCNTLIAVISFMALNLCRKYRKLFDNQHTNFLKMSELSDKYKHLYEAQRDHNRTMILQYQLDKKNDIPRDN